MPLSLDSGLSASLRYGLVCSDYLAFAGEKTSVCGSSGGLKMTLPVSGGQGFTFRSDQRHQTNVAIQALQDACMLSRRLSVEKYMGSQRSHRQESL